MYNNVYKIKLINRSSFIIIITKWLHIFINFIIDTTRLFDAPARCGTEYVHECIRLTVGARATSHRTLFLRWARALVHTCAPPSLSDLIRGSCIVIIYFTHYSVPAFGWNCRGSRLIINVHRNTPLIILTVKGAHTNAPSEIYKRICRMVTWYYSA